MRLGVPSWDMPLLRDPRPATNQEFELEENICSLHTFIRAFHRSRTGQVREVTRMARVDAVSEAIVTWSAKLPRDSLSAIKIAETRPGSTITGKRMKDRHPLLFHYVSSKRLPKIKSDGIGAPGRYVWFTPVAYSACMSPYRLGLPTPRDILLVVDPGYVSNFWGPGTAPEDNRNDAWRGGGIEYAAIGPVVANAIKMLVTITPCGDIDQTWGNGAELGKG